MKAQEAERRCLSNKVYKALELQVLSVPQGHTIPSGATVITENSNAKISQTSLRTKHIDPFGSFTAQHVLGDFVAHNSYFALAALRNGGNGCMSWRENFCSDFAEVSIISPAQSTNIDREWANKIRKPLV